MTTEKTYILVEVIHKGPLKKTVAQDLPGKISRTTYDHILARGCEVVDVNAKQVQQPKELE